MHAWMYVCMYASRCTCMRVYVCMYVHVCIPAHYSDHLPVPGHAAASRSEARSRRLCCYNTFLCGTVVGGFSDVLFCHLFCHLFSWIAGVSFSSSSSNQEVDARAKSYEVRLQDSLPSNIKALGQHRPFNKQYHALGYLS